MGNTGLDVAVVIGSDLGMSVDAGVAVSARVEAAVGVVVAVGSAPPHAASRKTAATLRIKVSKISSSIPQSPILAEMPYLVNRATDRAICHNRQWDAVHATIAKELETGEFGLQTVLFAPIGGIGVQFHDVFLRILAPN